MSVRSSSEDLQHTRLIEALVESLQQRDYVAIKAEHIPSFADRRPEPIYSTIHDHYFIPDVVAEKDGRQVLFEVETSGSLDAPSTRAELATFAIHAAEHDMLYYLVVPEEIRKRAEMALEMIEERKQRATFVLSMPS